MITILEASPHVTIQDLGRPDRRGAGIPPSGALDHYALASGNLVVGNPAGSAGLEWALSGGSIRFERAAAFALTGAGAVVTLNGSRVPSYTAVRAEAGDIVVIDRLVGARLLYVALSGGIEVPAVLGSRSTYLPGRFGGLDGRRIRSGDVLPLGASTRPPARPGFQVPEELQLSYAAEWIRVVAGPQRRILDEDPWRWFLATRFEVSQASNRMGYRLEGPGPRYSADAGMPSEPVCPGAVQLPAGGAPIVLLADGPTVGGYPMIAVVISADLPLLAQRLPNAGVRFQAIALGEAQAAYGQLTHRIDTIARLVTAQTD